MKITKEQLEKLVESIVKEQFDGRGGDDEFDPADNRGQIAPRSGGRRRVSNQKVFELLALIPKMTPEQLEMVERKIKLTRKQ